MERVDDLVKSTAVRTWDYRVVVIDYEDGEYLQNQLAEVRGVEYDTDGSVYWITSSPVELSESDADFLKSYYEQIAEAFRKPVLLWSEYVPKIGLT